MEQQLRIYFFKHIEKMSTTPNRRHLRFGLPFYVGNITKQASLVYQIDSGDIFILHCFATHKEYERWYLSYK
jgi:hypothetical protein